MPAIRSTVPLGCLLLTLVMPGTAQEEPAVERPLGSSSALLIETDVAGSVLIEAGTKLHDEPHRHAPVVTVVDVTIELEPLESIEGWVRVRFAGRAGWASLDGLPEEPEPPPTTPPPAPPPLSAPDELSADAERLARALALLDGEPATFEAGVFRLHTDIQGERKRKMLFEAASHIGAAYRQRYGLEPERKASFAVVIYDREESYRRFEETIGNLSQLAAKGHTGSGVAALVAEQRTAPEATALLIHELAHLLNRQTFRGDLPPWLEEGIANDLAYCQIGRSGRLQPGTLGGKGFIAEVPGPPDRFGRRRFAGTVHIEGPLASLSLLKRKLAAGETVPLAELLDLTWREFVAPEGRELRYVESTFLLRYLLDELDGEAFRRFLRDFQAGGRADAATLLAALGVGWAELGDGFEEWITRHTGRG